MFKVTLVFKVPKTVHKERMQENLNICIKIIKMENLEEKMNAIIAKLKASKDAEDAAEASSTIRHADGVRVGRRGLSSAFV